MKFFLATTRHTRTQWNDQRRYSGQANPHLDEVGIEQAKALADTLDRSCLHYIYTSDLTRCVQLAEIVGSALRIPVIKDERLREVDVGAMTGLVKGVVEQTYPPDRHRTHSIDFDFSDIGGESADQVLARFDSFFETISCRHLPIVSWGPKILIVSHGTSLRRWFWHIGAKWNMPQGTRQNIRFTL
jgi:broad specificity phosphatase PhoE